jgi:RNA polymerase sigma-70 factor (ECF subfamily)
MYPSCISAYTVLIIKKNLMTLLLDPDTKLMVAFQRGDETAFTCLFEKYKVSVFNIAYRFLANKDAAEDAAQDVFIKVYAIRKKYQPQAKFSTWLYRITINTCSDVLRRQKKHISLSDLDEKPLDEPSPQEVVEVSELVQQVRSAISSLPNNHRTAIILQKYEGLSYDEIADIMKMSRAAVESLLFRARQSLKVKLAHHSEYNTISPVEEQAS